MRFRRACVYVCGQTENVVEQFPTRTRLVRTTLSNRACDLFRKMKNRKLYLVAFAKCASNIRTRIHTRTTNHTRTVITAREQTFLVSNIRVRECT